MRHFMRIFPIGFIISIAVVSGCASAPVGPLKYLTNWDQLRVGMSKNEVIDLLGESSDQVKPGKIEAPTSIPSMQEILGQVVMKWAFDLDYERWHYGKFKEMLANLLNPDPTAFVVYFDDVEKVVKWRRPLIGPESKPAATNPAS